MAALVRMSQQYSFNMIDNPFAFMQMIIDNEAVDGYSSITCCLFKTKYKRVFKLSFNAELAGGRHFLLCMDND